MPKDDSNNQEGACEDSELPRFVNEASANDKVVPPDEDDDDDDDQLQQEDNMMASDRNAKGDHSDLARVGQSDEDDQSEEADQPKGLAQKVTAEN